jgi:hypothetical protein
MPDDRCQHNYRDINGYLNAWPRDYLCPSNWYCGTGRKSRNIQRAAEI